MSHTKIKVGLLIGDNGDTGIGGAESMVVNLCRGLIEYTNIEPEIYTRGNKTWIAQQGQQHGFEVIKLPSKITNLWSIKKLPLLSWRLGNFLKERKIKVLHSHMYPATLRGAAACYLNNIPHVATQHDVYTIQDKRSRALWLRLCALSGSKLVVISNNMHHIYTDEHNIKFNTTLVYNGINVNEVINAARSNAFDKELGNSKVIISVGRLERIKGFDLLIQAFSKLNYPNTKLLIVGDGRAKQMLQQLTHTLSLEQQVIFTGSRNDVPSLLKRADIFALASHTEGLSCSILEAMAAGLPCVVTDVGGNHELITNTQNGFLVPVGDISALTEKLKTLLDSPQQEVQQYKHATFNRVMTHFSLPSMVSSYVNLYQQGIK